MTKYHLTLLFFVITTFSFSQIKKYPVFKNCDTVSVNLLPDCFNIEVKKRVLDEFEVPNSLIEEDYSGLINIVFLVDLEGKFSLIYVNSPYTELKEEVNRVFSNMPKIEPAKFNNLPIEMQFVLPLKIPLAENNLTVVQNQEPAYINIEAEKLALQAYNDSIANTQKSIFPELRSELNIPFVHADYDAIENYLNNGINGHTAVKPYLYSEVVPYVDLEKQKSDLLQNRKTWFGRKLWNEHLVNVKGQDFWLTLDLPIDLQLGNDADGGSTFNNTRALQVNGGIGKKFAFSTTFFESQGKFAQYFNEYAESMAPDGGNPAIIPGRGIAKRFNSDAYDYPVAEAYLSFTASKHFSFQFGNGKNFIGDGYRSLLLSDVASPYPFFKINTSFSKFKYTNIWMWGQDVRPELTVDGAYKQKFMAVHYLSWNISKRFNLGLYESVIWDDANGSGFNVSYINPIIFYTAVEFATGSRAGNVLLGLNLKYKAKNSAFYGQLILDELRKSEITSNSGWWANKFGFQLGAKFFNAFKVDNLYFQMEFNAVRPYTYSHDELNYNFGHNNQPMAHLWGANFREFVGIGRYNINRWYFDTKIVFGKKGFDFNTTEDSFSYGGDIYRDNDDRAADYDNKIAQGNTANIFVGDLQAGYLVNPATNLKIYARIAYRNINPDYDTGIIYNANSTWVAIGLRTEIFNWYFDF